MLDVAQPRAHSVGQEMYVSIRTRQILHPMPKDAEFNGSNRRTRRRSLQITGSRMGAFKRSVGTIMLKAARESMFRSEPVEVKPKKQFCWKQERGLFNDPRRYQTVLLLHP